MTMNTTIEKTLSKVPEVTLVFWVIKILATTLGETGGDAVSMSLKLGYLVATAIFAAFFVIAVVYQILAKRFHPIVYWVTIIATTRWARLWPTSPIVRSASYLSKIAFGSGQCQT